MKIEALMTGRSSLLPGGKRSAIGKHPVLGPIRIGRLGTQRLKGEGLRIGTVRRPPRGVPKDRFAKDDWYDVWLPALSPSPELVAKGLASETPQQWNAFVRGFRGEMKKPDASHLLDLLASLSHQTDMAVGCYCEDEARCHRSVLRTLLEERGASVV